MNRLRYICISTKIMRMLKIYTSIMTTSVVTTSGAFTLLLCLAFIFTFYPNPCGIAHATTTLTQADIDSGTVSGDTEYIINTDINYSSSNLSIGTSSTSATLTITDGATFTLYNIPDFVIYDTMNLDNGNLSYTSTTTVLMSLANGLSLTNGSTFTVNGQVLFGGPIMGLGQLSNSTGALSVTEGSTFTLGGGAQYYASDLFVDSSTAYIGDESVGKTSFARSDNTGSGAIIIQNNSQVYWTARTIESYDIYFDTFILDNNSVFYLGVDTNAGSTILYLDGTMSITNNSRFFAQTSDIQLGKDSTDFNNAMSYITDSYFEVGLTGYTSGSLQMYNNNDLTINNSTFVLQGGASFYDIVSNESGETSGSDTIVENNSYIIVKDTLIKSPKNFLHTLLLSVI